MSIHQDRIIRGLKSVAGGVAAVAIFVFFILYALALTGGIALLMQGGYMSMLGIAIIAIWLLTTAYVMGLAEEAEDGNETYK